MAERVVYRSFISDNTRWDELALREGDIVISTPSKCGTTWTQMLVALLVFDGPELPGPLSTVSPWLDMTIRPLAQVVAQLDAQTHRRFIKTHTPLDGLVLDDRVTYVGVGRDPRDAAVSMAYHSANMDRDRLVELRSAATGPDGLEDEGGDERELSPLERFRAWIEGPNRPGAGIESLETVLHHFSTFWSRRHRPNVAMFHYADYQDDLPAELVRLARVLGWEVSERRAAELARHASLDTMRSRASELAPNTTDGLWKRDERFFRSGGGGEWRAVFTDAEHRRYDERVAELVDDDLAAWAHHGRRGADPDT